MLPFDSYGAIHPKREWRKPCSVDSQKKQKAPEDLESPAQALDGVEFDYSGSQKDRPLTHELFSASGSAGE